MHKTQTAFIDVNVPRKKTPLQELREQIEARTNQGRGPSIISGDTSLEYCAYFLPGAPVLTVDLDAILDSFGNQVGEIDNGEVILYDSLDQQPVLFAQANRVTSASFNTPSDATYVVDVWFDWLHANPETMWQFNPDTSITTTADLDSQVLVQVLYVGIANE